MFIQNVPFPLKLCVLHVTIFENYLTNIYIYFIRTADLGRMYNLVSRITDGLGELKKLLETHIHNQGLAAIEKCGDSALNVRQQTQGRKKKKLLNDFCY